MRTDPAIRGRHWRTRGRYLALALVAAIALIDARRRWAGEPAGPPIALGWAGELAFLGVTAAIYAIGKKLGDLTQEHGLSERPWLVIGYGMTTLAFLALIPFTAGATLLMVDTVFHGIFKGKVDTRAHFIGGLVIVPATVAIFALFPGARVDWPTAGILLVTGTGWMWLNNRTLRLGDHLLHQTRADAMVVLGLLCLVDVTRWLPVLVVVGVEHVVYAAAKRVAMRMPWYDDGHGIVPGDHDQLGLAFHSATPRAGACPER